MRRLLAIIALVAATLGVAATAQAGALPGPIHGTRFGPSTPYCQYNVIGGVLVVYPETGSKATDLVVAVVTNNAGTKTTVLYGTVGELWTHGVWRTYGPKNVVATVAGHRCTY